MLMSENKNIIPKYSYVLNSDTKKHISQDSYDGLSRKAKEEYSGYLIVPATATIDVISKIQGFDSKYPSNYKRRVRVAFEVEGKVHHVSYCFDRGWDMYSTNHLEMTGKSIIKNIRGEVRLIDLLLILRLKDGK